MTDTTSGKYHAKERLTIAEVPGLRVRQIALGENQFVPWHYHNNVSDTFFCMQGPMQIHTREPNEIHILHPGETYSVAPLVHHFVNGLADQPCRFITIQGVGVYDYIAVDAPVD